MQLSNTFTRLFSAAFLVVVFTAASISAKAQVYISGPGSVPCGGTGFYSAYSFGGENIVSYSWFASFSSGGAASGGGPSFFVSFPSSSGTANISLTAWYYDQYGRYQTAYATYYTTYGGGVAPAQPGTISGTSATCTANGTHTYSISAVSGASTYTWEASSPYKIVHPSSGALVGSYTGTQTSVSVRFPSSGSVTNGYVRVRSNSSGACAASSSFRSKTVKFGPQNATMNGPTTVSRWGFANYSISGSNLSNVSWTAPTGFSPLGSTSGTTSVTYEIMGTTSGYVTANYTSCGVSKSAWKYVTVSTGGGGGPVLEIPYRGVNDEVEEIVIESIYPNPASDVVTVSSTSDLKAVYVMNVVGQTVLNVSDLAGKHANLNVGDLKAGNYFVIVISEEGKKTHQLVVE